ncbi:MAG: polysaccharide deacetylase family protein [Chthoniobacterales bacterium]
MIISRSALASCFAMFLSFAACQSVKTQGIPLVDAEDTTPMSNSIMPEGARQVSSQTPSAPTPSVDQSAMVGVESPVAANVIAPVEVTPPTPKHAYNSVDVDGPFIALTFDDGPHPVHTPKLLDLLKSEGVKATFFVIGKSVETYPEIAKRIVAEGHEIANHTWTHPSLSKLGAAGVKREIDRTTEVIRNVTGVTPKTMRPPYGATNARINKRLDEEFGLKVIMWSVDPLDWKYRNASRVTSEIVSKTQPGGIVLAHDIHPSTVAAMPATIDGLKAKGFRFVTVSELLSMERGQTRSQPDQIGAIEQPATPVPAPTPFVVTRTALETAPTPTTP